MKTMVNMSVWVGIHMALYIQIRSGSTLEVCICIYIVFVYVPCWAKEVHK